MRSVAVIGGGWTGLTAGRVLQASGLNVEVFERSERIGGHSRSEVMQGVIYEPNGAHIFHTSNPRVADFVQDFGLSRRFTHQVKTLIHLSEGGDEGHLLSWPIQVQEIERLPIWPRVREELEALPAEPHGDDFESYVVSMMGRTLYDLFIRDYTEKQWGRPPNELSSTIAPKRVELRRDGRLGLFSDKWEFFPPDGMSAVLERVADGLTVHVGETVDVSGLEGLASSFDLVIVTAPLDDFCGQPGLLDWRGIQLESDFIPEIAPEGKSTANYVINYPDARYEFTRTIETKHATGQIVAGTVVSREYPGAKARHYPVLTLDRRNERRNDSLKEGLSQSSPLPVVFAGRLANYQYINQDQAIEQGFAAASEVIERLNQP